MSSKDTQYHIRKNIRGSQGKVLDLSIPAVMGILNTTPDSFYDGGRNSSLQMLVDHAGKMIAEGAVIMDIGGVSTRPGAREIDVETEILRVLPVIEAIRKNFSEVFISVDSYRAKVAELALQNGCDIINDISGGTFDQAMFEVIRKSGATYVLMHIQGRPEDMQVSPEYKNVVDEVYNFLEERVSRLQSGSDPDLIIDPGFGFGKNTEHNYLLLKNIYRFKKLGPVLAGISRKSMVNKVAGTKPETALNGTSVLNTIALLNGADILRVHDVKEAVEAVKLTAFYKNVD